jgi:flagellar hook-associated protein 2
MATITALGIGSGLDANSIVAQLMQLEQRPLINLQVKEAGYYADLSALGQLRSAVSSFKDAADALKSASDFDVFTATSADTAIFTASADSSAADGTFDIQVQSLAQAQKQGSTSFSDSDTTTVGTAGDVVEITVGSDSFSVEIGGKTLDEIASAINDAADNLGVTASVIQEDSSNYYLTLTSDDSGTANAMTLAFEDSGGSPIADPLGMAQLPGGGAADATILVDNTYTITRSTNTITDAIDGVSITLLDTSASAVKLNVAHNSGAVTNAIQGLADAYNSLQSTISELGTGQLSGDSTLRTLQNQVRSVVNTAPSGLTGDFSYLFDIGIEFEKDGTMSVDSAVLNDAVSTNLSSVAELFSDDDQGVAFRLSDLLDNILDDQGLIDAEETGLNAQIDSSQDAQERWGLRLVQIEARYRAQYAALDILMSNMSATSTFLDQQLEILSNLLPSNRK